MICPISSNGDSTGFLPIHIKTMKLVTSNQNAILFLGFILADLVIGLFIIGKKYKIAMDIIKASTPPNLLGIDRKIAYIGRKYHSG